MDFKLNEKEFTELVHDTLQNEYILGLSNGLTIVDGKTTHRYDLCDETKGYYIVIKLNYNSRNRSEIKLEIKSLTDFLLKKNQNNPFKLILVIGSKITDNDRKYYQSELRNNSKIEYTIFDIEDILSLAKKNNIKYSDIFLKFLDPFPVEKHREVNIRIKEYEKYLQKTFDEKTKIIKSIFTNFKSNVWWLNASKEFWNTENYEIGNNFLYNKRNDTGRLRSNLKNVKIGDLAISYQKDIQKIDSIYQVVGPLSEESISFRLVYNLPKKVTWQEMSELNGFKLSTVSRANAQGTSYKLDQVLTFEIFIHAEVNVYELNENINTIGIGLSHENIPPLPPNNNENSFDGNEDSNSSKNNNDQTKFRHDIAVKVDELGRQSVAKEFVSLIKNDIFNSTNNNSFIVHLQGEWGAGKSSFLNFIESELKSNQKDNPWVVIEYNAWQNQHITPPWWTLLNQIYRQSKKQAPNWIQRWILCFNENWRRIKWYSSWKNVLAFCLTIFFVFLFVYNFKSVKSLIVSNKEDNPYELILNLIVGLGSVIGLIHFVSKLVSNSLLIRSSEDAEGFVKKSQDPMSRIKLHYQSLIDNVRRKNTNIAVFIDDIDRCNEEYVVTLLEGMQTLFKERKVLYIIAGDRKWLSKCFQNVYKNFDVASNRADNIGELFLQKTFQLSVRIPSISPDYREKYWHNIIGLENTSIKKVTLEGLSKAQKDEISEEISKAGDSISSSEFMEDLETKYNLTGDTVNNLIIEKVNKKQKEFEHALKDYHTILDINPRSILRLSNNYNIARAILISERKNYIPEKLVRWILIEELYPFVSDKLNEFDKINDVINDFNKTVIFKTEQKRFKQLIEGNEIVKGGKLTMEDIKNLKGI